MERGSLREWRRKRRTVEVSMAKEDVVEEEVVVQVLEEGTEATVGAVEVEGIEVTEEATGEDVAGLRGNLMIRERIDIVEVVAVATEEDETERTDGAELEELKMDTVIRSS